MAVINALKTGSWSDATVWPNNTRPTIDDEVHPAGFTITIDQAITVKELCNAAKNGGLSGGKFILNNGIAVVADITGGDSVTAQGYCVSTASNCMMASVHGKIVGGSYPSCHGLGITNVAGGFELIGDTIGGSTYPSYAVIANGTSVVNHVGNIQGGVGGSAYGSQATDSVQYNLTGAIQGGTGSSAFGVYAIGNAVVNVNGLIQGGVGAGAQGIYATNSAVINANNQVRGGAGSIACGVYALGNSKVKCLLNTEGGSGASAHGVYGVNSARIEVLGDVIGGVGKLAAGLMCADAATSLVHGNALFSNSGQSPVYGYCQFKRRSDLTLDVLTDNGRMQLRPYPYTDAPMITLPAPPTEQQSIAWLRCIDSFGAPVSGVEVSLLHIAGGKLGHVHQAVPITAPSDQAGLVYFTLPRIAGLRYQVVAHGRQSKEQFISQAVEFYEIPVAIVINV